MKHVAVTSVCVGGGGGEVDAFARASYLQSKAALWLGMSVISITTENIFRLPISIHLHSHFSVYCKNATENLGVMCT